MAILDNNGKPVGPIAKPQLVHADGEVIEPEAAPLTTKEIGKRLAEHMLTAADARSKSNEEVNKQMDILYWAALNILSHRILNIGLGFTEGTTFVAWDQSKADEAKQPVMRDFELTCADWLKMFHNGELGIKPPKQT